MGVKNVIITLGEKGAYFENKEENYTAPIANLNNSIVDTTGAGDAFNGAFAAALCEEKNVRESIEFANKCATKVVQKPGVTII